MDPSNQVLLDLLRLTDRSLTHVDSPTLHRMLAENVELRARAERLELVLHASQSIGTDALWHTLELSDAELTAEILDGAQALEVSTSADLVRHVDELHSLMSGGKTRLAKDAAEITSRSLLDAVNQALLRDDQPTTATAINGTVVNVKIVATPPRHKQTSKLRQYVMWPIAVGIVAAIVLFVMSRGSRPGRPKPSSPIPPRPDFVVDPPQPAVAPDEVPPEPQPAPTEMPQIAIDPPDAADPDGLIAEDSPLQPRPVVPEVERVAEPQSLKWNRVSGIVATQVPGSDSWYAVRADSSTSTSSAGEYQRFRVLGNSWAEARTESGIRVVLGPNAVARVAISRGDTSRVELDLEQGKVGIGGLPAATQLVVTRSAGEAEWLVSNSETELAFDVQATGTDLQLVAGAIRSDGKTFTGPAQVSLNDGGWVAGRLARRVPWLTNPPALSPIERQLSIIATEEGDLVAGLLANRAGLNDLKARAAAIWGLSLDPVRAVPLALASPHATQRLAAAEWLVDPRNDLATVRPVLTRISALLPRSQCNVPRWIAVVRGEMPISRMLAQNMLVGLGPTEPMFVREMALATLMKLTGQSFPYYDPRNPTRQAIAQIRTTLQPWINQLQ